MKLSQANLENRLRAKNDDLDRAKELADKHSRATLVAEEKGTFNSYVVIFWIFSNRVNFAIFVIKEGFMTLFSYSYDRGGSAEHYQRKKRKF